MPTTVRLADIEQERANIFRRLVSDVLRCDIARNIFAQIIDGVPTNETHEAIITGRSDLYSRTEPTQESKDESDKFCNSSETLFDNLELNAKVAQLYQDAPLHSTSFNMHLLELIAIAIHDIAGNLFATFHPNGEPPLPEDQYIPFEAVTFSTVRYIWKHMYPRGILDVVGYWAETYIFGGVVVFDRGPEEGARNCISAYLHPPRVADLFELQPTQIEQFISSSSQNGDKRDGVTLPFKCQPEAKRVNPYNAFKELNIYRDRYERKEHEPRSYHRCVTRPDGNSGE